MSPGGGTAASASRPTRSLSAMPFLVLDRLDKRFGDLRVLESVSLEVREGEVLALLGPSGSGKTTLLRLLAGFEAPDGGRILLGRDGEDVAPLPPSRRRFGMVFQHYALFPHLTVGENVAFGLESQGRGRPDREEIRRRVAEALGQVDLAGFEARTPGQISGGQQQRVALARALATRPRVLLLDEPLSNLDPALRERTRRELATVVRRVGITTVLVTHEQEEAFDLGDRVAVLHGGRLHQVGTPEELYEDPATRFVATFVGRASVLPARPSGEDRVEVAGTGVHWPATLPSASPAPAGAPAIAAPEGDGRPDRPAVPPLELVVRPEALAFVTATVAGALPGRVTARRYAGTFTQYRVALEAGPELEVAVAERRLVAGGEPAARVGQAVHVAPRPEGPVPRAYGPDGGPGPAAGRGPGSRGAAPEDAAPSGNGPSGNAPSRAASSGLDPAGPAGGGDAAPGAAPGGGVGDGGR